MPEYDDGAVEPDSDFGVFVRAKDRGMPTFTLVAGDASADLVVHFWVLTQLRVRYFMGIGMTMAQAVQEVRDNFSIPEYPYVLGDKKLDGAARIAGAMRNFPKRKLAD